MLAANSAIGLTFRFPCCLSTVCRGNKPYFECPGYYLRRNAMVCGPLGASKAERFHNLSARNNLFGRAVRSRKASISGPRCSRQCTWKRLSRSRRFLPRAWRRVTFRIPLNRPPKALVLMNLKERFVRNQQDRRQATCARQIMIDWRNQCV